MRVLLTGGAGYIGSHTAAALAARGHEVVILDNFANAERDVPARLERLTGQQMPVIEADIRDTQAVVAALKAHPVDAVIHFAALKAVGESEADPLLYYDMNIIGTIRLLQAMQECGVARIVFSSSATVYGQPDSSPILENFPTRVENIYGRTKLVMEDLIRDLARTGKLKAAANLRYFNPVGAHPSAMIGETPRGVPNNLMPYVTQVATGQRPHLNVFGNDYDTPDGTGVRDYIHVDGPRRGACPGAGAYLRERRVGDGKSRHGRRHLRAATGESVRDRHGAGNPAGHRPAPPGRRGFVLCQPGAGGSHVRLEGEAGCRGYVPRFLALAGKPGGD